MDASEALPADRRARAAAEATAATRGARSGARTGQQIVRQLEDATLQYLRVQKLINEHMTQRFSFLRLSNEVLKRIQSRILVDPFRFNPDSVRKIIVQIEALYVFAILKSSLYSQKSESIVSSRSKASPTITTRNPESTPKTSLLLLSILLSVYHSYPNILASS